ncbi:MAG: hypothetical protein HY807_09605 [Nitrospirae bacterium]|nr:hypothetical protein [Nitrospirota bacterium]
MPVSIITSKGQTPASLDIKDLKGALYSPNRKPVSIEEMKLAVRKHISAEMIRDDERRHPKKT